MKTKIILLMSVCLLGGCNVGPKYVKPSAPAAPAYKESAPAAYKESIPGEWQPAKPQDEVLKGKWWEVFKEPELNALEDQLNIDNQNIAQYFQNFMAARAQVREARSGYYPTATVNPSYTRSSVGGAAASTQTQTATIGTSGTSSTSISSTSRRTTIGDFSLPFDVSWAPDLWGRIRNTVGEYQYAAQVSAADLENER